MVLSPCLPPTLFVLVSALLTDREPPQGSGIYANAVDFRQGTLTSVVNCQSRTDRIRTHDFWNRPYVTVVYNGEKYIYAKESIFGLRDCRGNDYRYFRRAPFQIREVGPVVIYQQTSLAKNLGVGGHKQVRPIVRFYFSTSLTTPVLPLTKTALKQAFPGNDQFHARLDAQFHRTQDDLSLFDDQHHMYRINWLLQTTQPTFF